MSMIRKITAAAAAASVFTVNFTSAQDSVTPPPASPPKVHHELHPLLGALLDAAGKKVLPARYWYEGLPNYDTDIAPYLANQEAFADFMNKYREPRQLTEQEALQIIIQLGIPQHAPEWLTPATSLKIKKIMHSAKPVKTSAISPYMHLAMWNATRPLMVPAIMQGADSHVIRIDFADAAPGVGFFAGFMTAAAFAATIEFTLTAVAVGGIAYYLTLAAQKAIQKLQEDHCSKWQCQTSDAQKPQTEEQQVEGGGANKVSSGPPGNCTPDQHRKLQDMVENACGTANRCTASDSLANLNSKIGTNSLCIDARRRINDICFNGGDAKHNNNIMERLNAIERCKSLLSKFNN